MQADANCYLQSLPCVSESTMPVCNDSPPPPSKKMWEDKLPGCVINSVLKNNVIICIGDVVLCMV